MCQPQTMVQQTMAMKEDCLDSSNGYDSDDAIVPEEELEKIRVLL